MTLKCTIKGQGQDALKQWAEINFKELIFFCIFFLKLISENMEISSFLVTNRLRKRRSKAPYLYPLGV